MAGSGGRGRARGRGNAKKATIAKPAKVTRVVIKSVAAPKSAKAAPKQNNTRRKGAAPAQQQAGKKGKAAKKGGKPPAKKTPKPTGEGCVVILSLQNVPFPAESSAAGSTRRWTTTG